MMSQLQLTGALEQAAGFVFGQCTECEPGDGYGSLTLAEILDHYIRPLNIPASTGAMIGHISRQFILPVGEIGRASGRARGGQRVKISVFAVSLKNKNKNT